MAGPLSPLLPHRPPSRASCGESPATTPTVATGWRISWSSRRSSSPGRCSTCPSRRLSSTPRRISCSSETFSCPDRRLSPTSWRNASTSRTLTSPSRILSSPSKTFSSAGRTLSWPARKASWSRMSATDAYWSSAVLMASRSGFWAATPLPEATYPSLMVQMMIPPRFCDFTQAPLAAMEVGSS